MSHHRSLDTPADQMAVPATAENRSSRDRVLTSTEIESIARSVEQLCSREGMVSVTVSSVWQGELRWARNLPSLTSDRRNVSIFVARKIRSGGGSAATNQLDEASLRGVVQSAERQALEGADQRSLDFEVEEATVGAVPTTTWSEATYGRTQKENALLVQEATTQASAKGILSAGYLESRAFAMGTFMRNDYGKQSWFVGRMTQAQCTATVRHPNGTGSGWAAGSSYDFAKVSDRDIARRALDKCLASLDPVRIEPGRYTTILEPQAVAQLVDTVFGASSRAPLRDVSENGQLRGTFWLGWDESVQRDRSKLGLKVMDERITIDHDPSDPDLGLLPVDGMAPITYVKNGVLTALSYKRGYGLNEMNRHAPDLTRGSYRMSGGTTTMDEMIATTKRGLLLTRFSSIRILDQMSLLSTGLTRDGLWLIENGKITKSVRNFRFTESALFVLNNVVELGVPVPVFHPFEQSDYAHYVPHLALTPVIVPPLKVNDFSFTSTIDAI